MSGRRGTAPWESQLPGPGPRVMSRADVVIHVHHGVPWQVAFLDPLTAGLRAAKIAFALTGSRSRVAGGLPLLLGTTFWSGVEDGGPFLLVDRCSFGDPGRWVTIVRDGHGRRGDHRAPESPEAERWERHGVPVAPWRDDDDGHVVLCGQTRAWSPRYAVVAEWYGTVAGECTRFRPHPADNGSPPSGADGQLLPLHGDWNGVARAVTLNSSVAVEAVLRGIPAVAMDDGAMAWDVTGRHPADVRRPDRSGWLHWLAWTQWHHEEIRAGHLWRRFL